MLAAVTISGRRSDDGSTRPRWLRERLRAARDPWLRDGLGAARDWVGARRARRRVLRTLEEVFR